jgi:hypothetical protein
MDALFHTLAEIAAPAVPYGLHSWFGNETVDVLAGGPHVFGDVMSSPNMQPFCELSGTRNVCHAVVAVSAASTTALLERTSASIAEML